MLESPVPSTPKYSEVFLIMLNAEEQMGRDFKTSGSVGVSLYNRLMGMASLTKGHFIKLLQRVREGICGYLGRSSRQRGVTLIMARRSLTLPRLWFLHPRLGSFVLLLGVGNRARHEGCVPLGSGTPGSMTICRVPGITPSQRPL